jgi:hypothetical protein
MKKIIFLIIIIVVAVFFFRANRAPSPGEYKNTEETIVGDFDTDGDDDTAFLVSEQTSTTTLYYLIASLRGATGYENTSRRYIGNQIIPVNVEFKDGHLVVNYLDRKEGEPITAEARFWHSKTFGVRDGELVRAIGI